MTEEVPQYPAPILDEVLPHIRMGGTMNRLSDYGTIDPDSVGFRLTDVEGEEVEIHGVDFRSGTFGEYAVIGASWGEDEKGVIITGAYLVMDALKDANEQKAFPLAAMFQRKGRTWMIN